MRVNMRHHMQNFVAIAETVVKIWQYFDFSRWRLPPSWIFKIWNFNRQTAQECQTASPCQIWSKSVKTRPRYGDFSIFQDGGRRHLGFFKFQIFNGRTAQEGRTASLCQIWSKSAKTRPRYGDFSILQDGAATILDFLNFKFLTVGRLKRPNCVAVPNLAEIGQNAAKLWRIFDFSRWRPPPSWIFQISNF